MKNDKMKSNKGFVFTGMAFLLVIPAIILAASFGDMIKTGDVATTTAMKSDVVFFAYENIQSNLEKASCNYFLLNENDTAAIKNNLTNIWVPYIEENLSAELGINVAIAEDQINVIYYSATDSIKVGNINDIDEGISMDVTASGVVHSLGLIPIQVYKTCSEEAVEGAREAEIPGVILFLHKRGPSPKYYMNTEDPKDKPAPKTERIDGGDSQTWIQDPAFTYNFNVTGNIDIYLYFDPEPSPTCSDGGYPPAITVSLSYDDTSLGSAVGDTIVNESWWVFTVTGMADTAIPAGSPISLLVSVAPDTPNPCVDIWYDSMDYNSGVDIPGSETTTTVDTIPPVFHGIENAINNGSCATTCAINLYWSSASDPSTPITYNIYRSTSSGFTPNAGNRIATGISALSYQDTVGLTVGQTYYYIVRAVDSAPTPNEDTNTIERSATPYVGGPYTEYLYANGSVSGSSDIITVTTLYYDGTGREVVVVNKGDVDIVEFTDPSRNASEITSAVVYWIDRNAGTATNKDREVEIGDGTVWNWNSATSNPPALFTTYDLSITSHFLDVAPDDNTDIRNVKMRYKSNADNDNQYFYWDQAYIVITYT